MEQIECIDNDDDDEDNHKRNNITVVLVTLRQWKFDFLKRRGPLPQLRICTYMYKYIHTYVESTVYVT